MRGRRSVLLAACLALSCAAATPAAAIDDRFHDPGDAVAGHPGLTYFDLIKRVAPDLAKNAADGEFEGHLAKPPRNLAGDEFEGADPPDTATVGFIEDRRIRVGGKPRMALLVDLGGKPDRIEGLALLMLFTDAPKPRLLDAADVGVDKDTSFSDQWPVLHVGPGDDALVTYSEHDDADYTAGGYLVVSPIGDHLRMVGLFGTQSVKACGWSNIETTTISTSPDPGGPYRQIDVKVGAVFRHTDPSCGAHDVPKAHSAAFHATYRWNAAAHAFETPSHIAARLKAFNDRVFK
jgi:hypothetical protein